MVRPNSPDAISVLVEHLRDDAQTVASFVWPSYQPTETYTIDKAGLSIRLDEHIAARPNRLTWNEGSNVGEPSIIDQLFGSELTDQMLAVRQGIGFAAIELTLQPNNIAALADLQLHSPSTPAQLRHILEAMRDSRALPAS